MIKTKYASYCLKDICKGCKLCVKGRKLVLFVTGKCSRNCWYCSLSNKRKNKNFVWFNERKSRKIKDLVEEIKKSKAKGCGITGGDALKCLPRTLRYAKAMKKNFGKNFHIHIYLPLELINKKKLGKLSKYIDEIRFHPEFLIKGKEKINEDIAKIKLSLDYWKKANIGVEMPCIPNKKKEIFQFIKNIKDYIGFVNLNEFELSETNSEIVLKNYALNKDTYTVKNSISSGLWILKKCEKEKIPLKIHLCTAETKNWHQFKNRLKHYEILKYGARTKEGTVVYLTSNNKEAKRFKKKYFFDKKKKRYILSKSLAQKLIKIRKKVKRTEEYPTFDREIVEEEILS